MIALTDTLLHNIIENKQGKFLGERNGVSVYHNQEFNFVFCYPITTRKNLYTEDCFYHTTMQEEIGRTSYFDRFFHDIHVGMQRVDQYATHFPIKEQRRILDVGCANGGFLIACKLSNMRCYGIDANQSMIDYLESFKELNGLLHCCDIEKEIPFDLSYDCFILHDIIEHLLYPNNALVHLRQVMSEKGAYLIIDTPNVKAGLEDIFDWKHFLPDQHPILYSKEAIDCLVRSVFKTVRFVASYEPVPGKTVMINMVN